MSLFIDPADLSEGWDGAFQLLFLFAAYGYLLFLGASLLKDASFYLLLIPDFSAIVGSIVNPVLGAVPESVIVMFAGIKTTETAMAVGIGSLAGSTVVLLTLPWFLAVLGGRVDLDPETRQPLYFRAANAKKGKLSPENEWSFVMSGIHVDKKVKRSAWIMVVTTTPMIIAQFSEISAVTDVEPFIVAAVITSWLFFVGYMFWAWLSSQASGHGYHHPDTKTSIIQTLGPSLIDQIRQNLPAIKLARPGSPSGMVVKDQGGDASRLQDMVKAQIAPYYNWHLDYDPELGLPIERIVR